MTVITLIASGSRGDVQPYVALGQGLRAAGYPVRVLTSDDFEQLVTEAGLEFHSIGGSLEEALQSDEWRKATEGGNFLMLLRMMRREMKQRAQAMAQVMPDLLRGSDLIVGGMGLMGTLPIADHYNIPVVPAYVFPAEPTRAFPSPLTPKLPFGDALNRPSFRLMRQLLWQSSKASDAAARRVLGLPKGSFWGPFAALSQRTEMPVLHGYSPSVLPKPDDWDAHHHVTGYWYLDAATDWTPPQDLLDFLDAGPAPVYIGFGSMANRKPEEAGQIALEALERSGQRGVVATGWGGLNATNVPESVHVIASMPHSWLFPRMAAVVHHGGAGTTAAGFRAGVPSIIVPFMGDQGFWGQRAQQLGVGTAPIPRKQLTAERLAVAITSAVTSDSMVTQAADLGQRIRAEDGVAAAVTLIEQAIAGQIAAPTTPAHTTQGAINHVPA